MDDVCVAEIPSGPVLETSGDVASGRLTFAVADRFFLELDRDAGAWQPTRWRLGPTEPDLAVAPLMSSWNISLETPSQTARTVPTRATLGRCARSHCMLEVDTELVGTGGVTLGAKTRYTVYASGRVVVESTLRNAQAVARDIGTWMEFGHLTLGERVWSRSSVQGAADPTPFYWFTSPLTGAPFPSIVVTRIGALPDTVSRDAPSEGYFNVSPKPASLAPGGSVTRAWEVRLSSNLSEEELERRANDTRTSAIIATDGANARFDPTTAAYTVSAVGGSVTITIAEGARVHPSFVIEDWTAPTFRVTRGTTLLASDEVPATRYAAASWDPDTRALVISTVLEIDEAATDAERTVTVTP